MFSSPLITKHTSNSLHSITFVLLKVMLFSGTKMKTLSTHSVPSQPTQHENNSLHATHAYVFLLLLTLHIDKSVVCQMSVITWGTGDQSAHITPANVTQGHLSWSDKERERSEFFFSAIVYTLYLISFFRFRFGRILLLCTLYREGRKDSNHSPFADVTVLWLFRCTQPSSPLFYVSCNVTIAYKLYNRKERKIMPILKTVCLKVHLKQFNASPLQENLT